jgi:transposase
MDVVHERAAGIDISKRDAKVAVRVPCRRAGSYTTTVKTFGATTAQVVALSDYLLAQRVTTVVMEATSDYWKPFYYVMEDKLPVMLVNAKHARNIPGRKTDLLTELSPGSFEGSARCSCRLARFAARDQRRCGAGVVRAGGAAARVA